MEAEPNKAPEVERLGFIVIPGIDISYSRVFMGINHQILLKTKNPIQIGNWCNIHVISLRASSDQDWDWEALHQYNPDQWKDTC